MNVIWAQIIAIQMQYVPIQLEVLIVLVKQDFQEME